MSIAALRRARGCRSDLVVSDSPWNLEFVERLHPDPHPPLAHHYCVAYRDGFRPLSIEKALVSWAW